MQELQGSLLLDEDDFGTEPDGALGELLREGVHQQAPSHTTYLLLLTEMVTKHAQPGHRGLKKGRRALAESSRRSSPLGSCLEGPSRGDFPCGRRADDDPATQ